MTLSYDCWYVIFHFLDGDILTQLRIRSTCKELNRLQITDLYNIDYKYKTKLSDDILKTFKYLKYLCSYGNNKITDEGIRHMNLHTLDAYDNEK